MSLDPTVKDHRVLIVIDGSNFYHRAQELGVSTFIHFDYRRFAEWLAEGRPIAEKIYYTGIIRKIPGNAKSQQLVSDQQRLLAHLESPARGFRVFRGHVMKQPGQFREKGVDVKLAVDVVLKAVKDQYDTVILVSSDTDLIPAIEAIREFGKRVEYVGFSHRQSFALLKAAASSRLLRKQELEQFLPHRLSEAA